MTATITTPPPAAAPELRTCPAHLLRLDECGRCTGCTARRSR